MKFSLENGDLAKRVIETLRAKELKLAVAESCTGGMIGSHLTAIPGCSDVFVGGIIAYHNSVKKAHLGVSDQLLREHGAVSEAVALTMARAVTENLDVSVGLSVTGIAGPGGGTESKPVGTVWLAWYLAYKAESRLLTLTGTRQEIRLQATAAVLSGLLRRLESL